MTQAELFTELQSLGLPVAYGQFKQPTDPPFIVYRFVDDDDFKADNQNYVEIGNFDIELYITDKKDPTTEALVQAKLKSLRLPYSKAEKYISSEKMHQVTYSIQLIGG